MTLVKQPAVEQVLERPPDTFHEALMVSDIRILHVDPESQPLGEPFPLLRVAKYAFKALMNERFDTVAFDLLLGMDAKLFGDFDFDRQSVRVPSGFAPAEISANGAVARKQILDGPRQAVSGMRQAVGRRRPFIKHESWRVGPLGQRFFVNPPVLPKAADFGLQIWKPYRSFDGLKHHVTKRPGGILPNRNSK